MGQSIGSIGNSHKTKQNGAERNGADNQAQNQPSLTPGQRKSDKEPDLSGKRGEFAGGAEQGARSAR